ATEAHGGCERSYDQTAAEPRGELDRWFGERTHIGRNWPLHRLGRDSHVLELIVLAFVGDAILCFPERAHDLEAFVENALVVVEADVKRFVFTPVIAAPGGEIDAPVAQQ